MRINKRSYYTVRDNYVAYTLGQPSIPQEYSNYKGFDNLTITMDSEDSFNRNGTIYSTFDMKLRLHHMYQIETVIISKYEV